MWTQPVLTANGTIGINNFAVTSGGGADSDAYKAFDSSATSYCNKMNSGAWLEFYSAVTLTISDILITSQGGLPSQGIFQISHDAGTTWEQCGTWTDTDGLGESAHVILDDGSATGRYFRFLSQGKSLAKPSNNADFCNVTITADEASGDFDFYANTERDIVHKSLLAESLRVWLPFDESTTKDLCWNGWTAYNDVSVGEGNAIHLNALQLNKGYLRSDEAIEFGGADFTISFYGYMNSSSEQWTGFFCAQSSTATGQAGCVDQIKFTRNNTSTTQFECYCNAADDTTSSTIITNSDLFNARRHFELDYSHDESKLRVFLDGQIICTKDISLKRTGRYIFLGTNSYTPSSQRLIGSIDEFQIFDGVALHTTNFTPPTDEDYAQAKADWDGRFSLVANTERKLTNQALVDESLKVYLPFDLSTTEDLKGNEWTAYGSPTIQDTQLNLPGSSSYLAMDGGITLGGQNFTIRGKFNMDSAAGKWCRIFEIFNTSGSEADAIRLARDNTNSTLNFGCFDKSGTCSITLGKTYDFECCYVHSTGKFYFFLDGVLKVTLSVTIPQTTFDYCWLGRSNYSSDGYFVGSIDEFQIFDGVALHMEDFTPPTDNDYVQKKWNDYGYRMFDETIDLERNLSNASFNPAPFLKVWLPFDTSTTEDVCGNVWNANGSPTIGEKNAISGNALQVTNDFGGAMHAAHLYSWSGITLGDKSFTIKGSFNLQSFAVRSFDRTLSIFILAPRNSYRMAENLAGFAESIALRINNLNKYLYVSYFGNGENVAPLNLNQTYSFEVVYYHGLGKMFTFLDGVKVHELDITVPRMTFPYLCVDHAIYRTNYNATIDEFKIYDGAALHTENFAPATAENYVEKTLAEEGQIHFTFDAETERIVRNAVLVFEHSTEVAEGITTITGLDESKSKDGTAFYQTFQSKCFDLPPVPEIWIEFDIFCDGEHFWSAGNASSANGICGIAANADGSLSFISNGTTVKTVANVCEFGELQTIRLHMITGSSGGVIEAWTGPVLIYTYTGDVNHGDYFEDLFLQSDGEGTFFSSLFISNYSLDRDRYLELLFNTERKIYNGLFDFNTSASSSTQISRIIWSPPGGTYPPNFIIVTDTVRSKSGTAFSQTEIVKCFDLPPAYEIWIDFDVYFDGINRWRAGNAGAAGVCGIVASVDGTLNYICNGEIVHTVADVCAIEKVQPVLLHMVSDCNIPELGIDSGYIECWINGEYIFKYSGDVNLGEDFEDIFLQCDGNGTVFSMITFSTNRLDPRHYEDAPTIYLCMYHNGQVLSFPVRNYDSPITPALAVRYDEKNWYGKLVAPNDSNAGAIHLHHNNSDYALAIN